MTQLGNEPWHPKPLANTLTTQKMYELNPKLIQRVTQTIVLGVRNGRCSNIGDTANVGCSNFRRTNNDQRYNSTQRHQQKKLTSENCYFQSNHIRREYRKSVRESWTESARFNATSQRLTDLARILLKRVWFFWSADNRNMSKSK